MVRVVPSGGWSFPSNGDPDSNSELHIEPGYEELVQWLTGFRIANGKPVGNPALDIESYTARRNPRQHGEVPPPDPYAPTQVIPRTFREEITNWLAGMFSRSNAGVQFTDEEEAERRAQICIACPQNQSWKTGCPPCVENAERVIMMLSHGRKTSVHDQLMGCQTAKHANQAAVQLQLDTLGHSKETIAKAPPQCWMHTAE